QHRSSRQANLRGRRGTDEGRNDRRSRPNSEGFQPTESTLGAGDFAAPGANGKRQIGYVEAAKISRGPFRERDEHLLLTGKTGDYYAAYPHAGQRFERLLSAGWVGLGGRSSDSSAKVKLPVCRAGVEVLLLAVDVCSSLKESS